MITLLGILAATAVAILIIAAWYFIGPNSPHKQRQLQRDKVAKVIRDRGPITIGGISQAVGLSEGQVRALCRSLGRRSKRDRSYEQGSDGMFRFFNGI